MQQPSSNQSRHLGAAVRLLALAAIAGVFAAGCGGVGTTNADVPKVTGPAIPEEPTVPRPDERLTSELGESGKTLDAAGCSFGRLADQDGELDNLHVEADQLTWKTNPPAAGRHLQEWAPWGVYDEQVPDGFAVHNLEHGGVLVWMGELVSDPIKEAIEQLPKDGEKWVVSPREDLDGLYSVAWGQGLTCSPAALTKLGTAGVESSLRAWFDAAESQGSPHEKDVPAYAGSMKDPAPTRDISTDPPF